MFSNARRTAMIKRKIAVLGSTGSIGVQALDVIRRNSKRFEVVSLAAAKNHELLARQIEEFKPKRVFIKSDDGAKFLRERFPDVTILCGEDGLCALASDREVDTVLNAVSGTSGLMPAICAVESGKRLCSANKESLVMAGEIIVELAKKSGATIIPVDSEHSAIFQALCAGGHSEIKRIIITASGGPFFSKNIDWDTITPEQALKHPNWQMGPKITVDSATLINKALEIIEAHRLFGVPPDKIKVIIHPQSIIHSIVEFVDGSQIAQLSVPDMRLPIQYALTYPERLPSPVKELSLSELSTLTFFEPDKEFMEPISLAYKVLEIGGTAPTVLCAADEVAVNAFLEGKLAFSKIVPTIKEAIEELAEKGPVTIEKILEADSKTREWVRKRIGLLS